MLLEAHYPLPSRGDDVVFAGGYCPLPSSVFWLDRFCLYSSYTLYILTLLKNNPRSHFFNFTFHYETYQVYPDQLGQDITQCFHINSFLEEGSRGSGVIFS